MQYTQVVEAEFLCRPNRFIAHVLLNGIVETVHVKNTGRCRELLVPGARVVLEASQNPLRRTKYSLVAVYKQKRLINMDSQAPNQVVYEALVNGKIPEFPQTQWVQREVTYGKSRFDIAYESAGNKDKYRGFIEVKGVTLEQDGIVLFPDAPTERGTKHVYELIDAVRQGHFATLLFLVQMSQVRYFTTHSKMDSKFSQAVKTASLKGVQILAYDTQVEPDAMMLNQPVPIRL